MIRNILVAFDGSESADKAYDYALAVAMKFGAKLRVLAVARPPDPPEDVETRAILEKDEERFEQRFTAMRQRAAREGVKTEFKIAVGRPAEQIIWHADNPTDLIVMGHSGKGSFERFLFGSVSQQVIRHANCAVMIVP